MPETAAKPADVSSLASRQISYADLYERWEQGNWKATEIDFSADRAGWEGLSEIQRRSALWIYSMFFYGEDSVTDNLSPYIDAAPREEQKYFLATQQVDEARHSVFFARFFREVIGVEGDYSAGLAYTLPQLNYSYRQVFDRLDRMADELRADRSLPKFAQAIALYHMVVEATLAQPGQHFIEDFFNREGTMPGFSAGMVNVSRDEQRHIGFGVKTLSECFARDRRVQGGGGRADARGPADVDGRLRPAELGPRVHARLWLRARGHLRVRDALGGDQVARRRLPDHRDAARRVPARLREVAGGARGERDQAARGGRHRRARRRARLLAGGAGDALRRDGAFGRPFRRGTASRSRSSGASRTPRLGTCGSTTARPRRSRARRPSPTSPSRRAGATGSRSRPGEATRGGRCFSASCARGATRSCC